MSSVWVCSSGEGQQPAVMTACNSDIEAVGRNGAIRRGASDCPRKTLAAAQRLSAALHSIVYSMTDPKTATCRTEWASAILWNRGKRL